MHPAVSGFVASESLGGLSRREFLQRSGSGVALVGVWGLLRSSSASAAASDEAVGLSTQQRAIYAALVAAIASAEEPTTDADAYVTAATAAFEGWYSRGTEDRRDSVRPVLGEFSHPEGRDFTTMTAAERLKLLRRWERDQDDSPEGEYETIGQRHRTMAAAAIVLAGPPFDPDTVETHFPLVNV